MGELFDNAGNHAFYVSVVVNNANDIIGKIAIRGTKKLKSVSTFSLQGLLGKILNFERPEETEVQILYLIDFEVEREETTIEDFFKERAEAIIKKSTERVPFQGNFQINGFQGTGVQKEIEFGKQQFNERYPVSRGSMVNNLAKNLTKKEEDSMSAIILRKCLGTDFYDTVPIYTILKDIDEDPQCKDNKNLRYFLETNLDSETVTENIEELGNGMVEVDSDVVIKVYNDMKNILSLFSRGRYERVVRIINFVIDEEIKELQEELEEMKG